MRIVYCINSISHIGGIARVVVAKANALAAIEGNEVWIAYTDVDALNPHPALPLDSRVHTIDLGIRYDADDTRGLYYRLRADTLLRRRHKAALSKVLDSVQPDIVISVGQSEKYFLPKLQLRKRPAFVREFHYNKRYRHEGARGAIAKIKATLTDFYDYSLQLRRYDAVAVLSEEDYRLNWSKSRMAGKTHVIPNPLTEIHDISADMNARTVVTTGRLTYQKNHEALLRTWSIVARRHPDWKLVIYGTGELENSLRQQISDLGLDNSVSMPGNVSDVCAHMAGGSIFAFTSRFEGFGLVLLEAASIGMPAVSFACPCGPRDIITDGVDGYLVEPGDENALAERLCHLIENESLRRRMGTEALKNSRRYAPAIIAEQWMNLFRKLLK